MIDDPIYQQMRARHARHPLLGDTYMRDLYVDGMTVADIAERCAVDDWIVQRAILGNAYGQAQRDITG